MGELSKRLVEFASDQHTTATSLSPEFHNLQAIAFDVERLEARVPNGAPSVEDALNEAFQRLTADPSRESVDRARALIEWVSARQRWEIGEAARLARESRRALRARGRRGGKSLPAPGKKALSSPKSKKAAGKK